MGWLLPLLLSSSPTPVVPLPLPRPPRSLQLKLLTLPPRVFMPDIPTDMPDGPDTLDTLDSTDTTVTLMVPSSAMPTVPLPPPRPLRFLPLSKLTLPLTVLPQLPLSHMLAILMLMDILILPTPDSLPTPMEPLSLLSPQMSSLPVKNIWLPMPLPKQENQLVM